MLFAVWAVIGHLAFFAGVTVKMYWLVALAISVLGFGFFLARASPRFGAGPASPSDPRSGKDGVTWLAIGLGVGLALCLHRPDADDRTYLGQEVKALDGRDASFRALARVPEYNAGYVMSTYEYLRAGSAWLTGVPLLAAYYLLWPALIAAMAVACQSRLLRLFGVENLALALMMWFVVMLAWGDTHRTPSNFGFARMFQGKSALIWVTIPAAQYYWLRFVEYRERRSLVLLYASVIAGVGFSPTGVPIGVLLIGLFTAATVIRYGLRRGQWKGVAGVAGASVYPIIVGLLMRFYFGHTPESGLLPAEILLPAPSIAAPALPGTTPAPPTPAVVSDVSRIGLPLILGSGARAAAAILGLVSLPFFLRLSRSKGLFSVYALLCTLLLLAFPWTSELLGRAAFSSFAWRWLFVIPFALGITIAVERISGRLAHSGARWAVAVVLAVLYLGASPARVLSEANHTRVTWPGLKLESDREAVLFGYQAPARIEGWRLISPATGERY